MDEHLPVVYEEKDRSGYVKAWRKVLESDTYQSLTSKQRDVFWVVIMLANWKDKSWEWNGEIIHCRPGQFKTSLDTLKRYCAKDTSLKNIRTALLKLEKWGFLTNESAKTGRIITICNWNTYQLDVEKNGKQIGSQAANDWQTGGKQAATTKKGKNDQERKEYIRSPKNGAQICYTPLFEKFWELQIRKVGKGAAFKAWKSSIQKNHVHPDVIIAAWEKQRPSYSIKERQFVPHPTTWLNGGRWEDDPESINGTHKVGGIIWDIPKEELMK